MQGMLSISNSTHANSAKLEVRHYTKHAIKHIRDKDMFVCLLFLLPSTDEFGSMAAGNKTIALFPTWSKKQPSQTHHHHS